ncbi:MAG: hypothetical protein P4N41_16620 [Negativicutes bacterium]|nr:hypothetical protein [Negativicutes bacterium]
MKNLCLAILMLAMMFGGTVWASPLMNYEAGKGSIDLTWRNTEDDVSGYTHAILPERNNLDATLTLGLGNNFAFQYRNFEPKSPVVRWNYGGTITTGQFKLTSNEFNVLYKLAKNVSVFAGDVSASGYRWTPISSYTTDTKNYWQVGLIGRTEIAPRTTLWASAAAGNDLTNWEAGVSYEFAPGWELNVNYRELKTNKLKLYQYVDNVKATGFGYGITYKF